MREIKNILIIEDEEANADRLRRLILSIRENFQILEVFSSIKNSVKWLSDNDPPDLMFMDIQLSDGVSFEIFNLIDVKCPVIFTTAYNEYALKAFKYNSIDYLLKPVQKDELMNAIKKFEYIKESNIDQNVLLKNFIKSNDIKAYRTRFLVSYRDKYIQVNVDSISYFISEFGSTYAMSFDAEKNLISLTLDSLEEQLDPKVFFRVNRQYIININSINQVHNYFNSKLKLDLKQSKEAVFISRLKAKSFKEWLDY